MQRVVELLAMPGTIEFRILANRRDHNTLIDDALESDGRTVRGPDGDVLSTWVPVAQGEEEHLLQSAASAETVFRKTTYRDDEWTECLVVEDSYDVNGSYFTNVRDSIDQSGRPCVLFTFNHAGGQRFGALTADNLPNEADGFTRHLGIILDGHLKAAPAIQATIFRHGQITGNFTQEDVQDLADVLNAGSLPAAIRIAKQQVIEPEQEASP
jgi:preprotein translocase subunit SecD